MGRKFNINDVKDFGKLSILPNIVYGKRIIEKYYIYIADKQSDSDSIYKTYIGVMDLSEPNIIKINGTSSKSTNLYDVKNNLIDIHTYHNKYQPLQSIYLVDSNKYKKVIGDLEKFLNENMVVGENDRAYIWQYRTNHKNGKIWNTSLSSTSILGLIINIGLLFLNISLFLALCIAICL